MLRDIKNKVTKGVKNTLVSHLLISLNNVRMMSYDNVCTIIQIP